MKTVSASLRGPGGPRDLGSLHADAGVRHLLGLRHDHGHREAPLLRLDGHGGMWLELELAEQGFILSMKDGEQRLPVDEMHAANRVRLFVEHYGDDTELTSEVRLPPEVRERIRKQEQALDRKRRERMATAPERAVFRRRKLIRSHEIVVDRGAGAIIERAGRRGREICRLAEVAAADVEREKGGAWRVTVRIGEEGESPLGGGSWSEEDAVRIAEAVNDAIDLSEGRRKFLRYRRAAQE